MRLFVTGGTGFVGAAVVDEAVSRGHDVVRLVRRCVPPRDGVVDVYGDVGHPEAWCGALADVDAVIHLAAAKGGSFHAQFATTVIGTEALLAAMKQSGINRLVHISTFSVYDYAALPVGSRLDESSPLESHPLARDEYAQTKLVQEQLVREFARDGGKVTIVRPGAVYGPGQLWKAGLAMVLPGGLGVAYAPRGRLKLTYVENCADAIVLAAEKPESIGATINVVDDDVPTQRAFARAMRRAGLPVPRWVPVPYRVARLLAASLALVNRRFLSGRAKLPGVFEPRKLDAQFRPLRYSNDTAKRLLGWRPEYRLDEALARSRDAQLDP